MSKPLLLFFGLVACGPVQPPERPAAVPTTAVWAGGRDGGSWIDCDPLGDGRYYCTNYHDGGGAVWDEGVYEYVNTRRSTGPPDSLRYSHFNGIAILLADETGSPVGAGSLVKVDAPRSAR